MNCLELFERPDVSTFELSAKQLSIHPCTLATVSDFIEKHHYSHSVDGVRVTQCFAVTAFDELVGAVLFGAMSTTAWKKFAEKESEVVELRRLVLIDGAGRNSESRVVGWTLRWLRKTCKHIRVVVSYADPAHGHSGTIYRASNFKYIGLSGKDIGVRDPQTGRIYHSWCLRNKYNGELKPFAKRLNALLEQGQLERVELPLKHCFVYHFSR